MTTVLYRFKTVHTVLAVFQLGRQTFLGIEVTAFFKRWTYRRCIRSVIGSNCGLCKAI